MREPFDTLVPKGKQIDEALGRALRAWAKGSAAPHTSTPPASAPARSPDVPADAAIFITKESLQELRNAFAACDPDAEAAFTRVAKKHGIANLEKLPAADVPDAYEWIAQRRAAA